MNKIKIKIPVILSEVPDEKDRCVQELIELLQDQKGLEKVHVTKAVDGDVPDLCFHYDPEIISIERVHSIARKTGASISEKVGHKLIEVEGIRHTRHARSIERRLRNLKGIIESSVSSSGMIRVEFYKGQIDEEGIFSVLRKEDLAIPDTAVNAEEYLSRIRETKNQKKEPKRENGDWQKAVGQEAQGTQETQEAQETHHDHDGLLGANSELIFSIISGVFLAIGFGLSLMAMVASWVSLIFYIVAYLFGGYYTAKESIQTAAKGGFEIDFLMLVAAIGAATLGKWAEGALLLFLFSLGHALEHYAMNRAHKSIAALADLAPKTALLKKSGGRVEEVGIEFLSMGDIIVVRPHSKIPADGVVIKGEGSVNQAPITGESVPVDKTAVENPEKDFAIEKDIKDENRVFSGTINGNNTLEIKVIKEAKDSTLSRLIKLVNEAQVQKSPSQRFSEKFEKYFVPSVMGLVVLLLGAFMVIDETFGDSFYRAMAVLVAASPCALAISTPSAVLSGIARAARSGVLIKGGRPLEDLGTLTDLAFDKTGTLTEGQPKLTDVVALNNMEVEELLQMTIAVEKLSDHPLAKAVVRDGRERLKGDGMQDARDLEAMPDATDIEANPATRNMESMPDAGDLESMPDAGDLEAMPDAGDLEAMPGRGIKAAMGKEMVYIGNLELYTTVDDNEPSVEIREQVEALEEEGKTTMLIRRNNDYVGIIALMDIPRKEAKNTLARLKKIGISRMVMLTGDNQKVADAVAKELGITEAWGSLLPEEKVDAIKKLKEKGSKVAMVGDGVNDAPAMAHSTVGIAMGAAGSDVALETADIALMGDNLGSLPFAIGLSRKTKNTIRQNLWISLGVVALLIPSTIVGLASIGIAVLIHEGSTLVVVLNALKLLTYKESREE